MILANYDANKNGDAGKNTITNAAYSLFSKAKGVFGGVASSV